MAEPNRGQRNANTPVYDQPESGTRRPDDTSAEQKNKQPPDRRAEECACPQKHETGHEKT